MDKETMVAIFWPVFFQANHWIDKIIKISFIVFSLVILLTDMHQDFQQAVCTNGLANGIFIQELH